MLYFMILCAVYHHVYDLNKYIILMVLIIYVEVRTRLETTSSRAVIILPDHAPSHDKLPTSPQSKHKTHVQHSHCLDW